MYTTRGIPEPTSATASTETLTTLRDRVETALQDSTNLRWATADIDEAIEAVLEEYNATNPPLAIHDHTVSTAGREQTVSITGLIEVKAVWWPYTAASLEYPPEFVDFVQLPGSIIAVDTPTAPQVSDHIRIWHTAHATISGLNAAGSTTVLATHIPYLLAGAASLCARSRAVELSETLNVDEDVVNRLTTYANDQAKVYARALRPADVPEPLTSTAIDKLLDLGQRTG